MAAGVIARLGVRKGDIRALQAVPFYNLLEAQVAVGRKVGGSDWAPVIDGVAPPRHPFDPDAPEVSADVPMIVSNMLNDVAFQMTDFDLDEAGLKRELQGLYPAAWERIYRIYRHDYPEITPYLLKAYGLSKAVVEAAGGKVVNGAIPSERKDFDLVVYGGTLGNAPEFNVWYEISQKYDLAYLQLPDSLLDQLARAYDMQRQDIPDGLLRGIDHPIPTVARTGHVVYARSDTPDAFAYDVAKALDEHQEVLQWGHLNFSYNIHAVAKDFGVPLHPGALRYYRERGYIK